MFCISLQIHPEHSRHFDREALLARVRSIRSPEVDAYDDKGQLQLAFNFFTEFPQQLWPQLQQALYGDTSYHSTIAPISIVICEDDDSGECRLLHHFDSNEALDSL